MGEGGRSAGEHRRGSSLPAALIAGLVGATFCTLTAVLLADSGVLVTPQSRQHLVAAASLAHGRGYEVALDTPLARYPPLYATLLATGAAAGLEPIPTIYGWNSLALMVSIAAVFAIAAQLGGRGRRGAGLPAIAAIAAIGFAALASNAYYLRAARPDGWMVALSLVAVSAALAYAKDPRPAFWWAATAAVAGATLARYMALFALLPPIAVFMGVCAPRRPFRAAALFAALAALPVVGWIARNLATTGFATGMSRGGERWQAAETTLSANIAGFLHSGWLDLFAWQAMGARHLVYDGESLPLAGLSAALAAAGFAGLGAALFVGRRVIAAVVDRGRHPLDPRARGVALISGCAAWYAAALLALWTLGNNDPINTRYVAPLYPFCVLLFAALATTLAEGGAPALARAGLLVATVAVLAPNVPKSLSLLRDDPPSRDLLEVSTRRAQRNHWHRDIQWSDLR